MPARPDSLGMVPGGHAAIQASSVHKVGCQPGNVSVSRVSPGHQFFFIVNSGGVFAYAFRDSRKEDQIGCPALDVKLRFRGGKLSLDLEGTPAAGLAVDHWLSGDLPQGKGDSGLVSTLGPSFLQLLPFTVRPTFPPGSHRFIG